MSQHSTGGQIGTARRTLKRFWPFPAPDRKLLVVGDALAVPAAGGEVLAKVFGHARVGSRTPDPDRW